MVIEDARVLPSNYQTVHSVQVSMYIYFGTVNRQCCGSRQFWTGSRSNLWKKPDLDSVLVRNCSKKWPLKLIYELKSIHIDFLHKKGYLHVNL
jgi:hypothetical protein